MTKEVINFCKKRKIVIPSGCDILLLLLSLKDGKEEEGTEEQVASRAHDPFEALIERKYKEAKESYDKKREEEKIAAIPLPPSPSPPEKNTVDPTATERSSPSSPASSVSSKHTIFYFHLNFCFKFFTTLRMLSQSTFLERRSEATDKSVKLSDLQNSFHSFFGIQNFSPPPLSR